MGPPELPGGNLSAGFDHAEPQRALQWGRRNYPAETHLPRDSVSVRAVASMGPPELPGGNTSAREESDGDRGASMGPPELPGGNPASRRQWCGRIGSASMGPPELPGGNDRMNRRKRTTTTNASMGPPELPGGNRRRRAGRGLRLGDASMGPPELPGGNIQSMTTAMRVCCTCFNGAAGITRRKLLTDIGVEIEGQTLQWGRRNYPAETGQVARRLLVAEGIEASMGPPELPGGNRRGPGPRTC